MKKIIDGKTYNTETAKKLADFESGWNPTDAYYYYEELFQKRTGEYFLAGRGQALSKYSEIDSGTSFGSEKIIPLTYNLAKQWAETNLESEEYEKIFGEVEEDNSRVTISLSLSATAVETAKRNAAQAGVGLSAYIESLIK